MLAVGALAAKCARLCPLCCALLPTPTLPVAPPRFLVCFRAALCSTQHIIAFTAAQLAPASGMPLPLLLFTLLFLPAAVLHTPPSPAKPAPPPAAVSVVPR